MNFDNFTIKSQETIQQAVQIATGNGNQAIEPVHLLSALMMKGESVVKFIFQKLGADWSLIDMQLKKAMTSLPKVSGGEPYLSRTSNEVLLKAIDESKKMGDEYVAIEGIFRALFKVNSEASKILKDAGLTESGIDAAIRELRKGAKADSQSAEESYNALAKYAINLN